MAPYIGEIRMFGGNFEPNGWRFCNGRAMSIAENDILFQLIGDRYGGDGVTTFNLPDLRGRVPIHQGARPGGSTYILGQTGGVEEVTLTINQIPIHTHPAVGAAVTGDQTSLNNALPANSVTITPYLNTAPDAAFNPAAVNPTGGSQPHENRQPFLCINFIISLFGVYPSQT
ncbi:phage tail protein [Nocardioides bizhenqiangii]|uniref:Tail fiber protein n=1 Tax=Nocardioides bizhenqiangii TaxID=3095076 RepID=A0ABZ0ZX15_9ACTN|nr:MULTISPECIES: tail fiber protein [unclassified Nocardioides]MDZ5623245.1 tail fiber protein [Nocardioides sp. HM23]WQQ28217.1 tail fiber protein [Nocardioides sp. HM61]